MQSRRFTRPKSRRKTATVKRKGSSQHNSPGAVHVGLATTFAQADVAARTCLQWNILRCRHIGCSLLLSGLCSGWKAAAPSSRSTKGDAVQGQCHSCMARPHLGIGQLQSQVSSGRRRWPEQYIVPDSVCSAESPSSQDRRERADGEGPVTGRSTRIDRRVHGMISRSGELHSQQFWACRRSLFSHWAVTRMNSVDSVCGMSSYLR